eukprot:6334411-Ditylum_brightwellii.AAC.1
MHCSGTAGSGPFLSLLLFFQELLYLLHQSFSFFLTTALFFTAHRPTRPRIKRKKRKPNTVCRIVIDDNMTELTGDASSVKFEMICNRGLLVNGYLVISKIQNVPDLRGYVPALGRETSL